LLQQSNSVKVTIQLLPVGSPTEAKLAYERRQRKRATATRWINQGSTNMVNHDIRVTGKILKTTERMTPRAT